MEWARVDTDHALYTTVKHRGHGGRERIHVAFTHDQITVCADAQTHTFTPRTLTRCKINNRRVTGMHVVWDHIRTLGRLVKRFRVYKFLARKTWAGLSELGILGDTTSRKGFGVSQSCS